MTPLSEQTSTQTPTLVTITVYQTATGWLAGSSDPHQGTVQGPVEVVAPTVEAWMRGQRG